MSEKQFDEEPISANTCAVVSITDILYYIIALKKRAVNERDKDLYEIADSLEFQMKILMDSNNSFERW
jgi:hypothetical protein